MKTKPKPAENPTPKPRGGRPTRGAVLLRAIEAAGIDPVLVDPRRILAGIAADKEAPATARVQACKALLLSSGDIPPGADDPREDTPTDELGRRALAILAGKGRPN